MPFENELQGSTPDASAANVGHIFSKWLVRAWGTIDIGDAVIHVADSLNQDVDTPIRVGTTPDSTYTQMVMGVYQGQNKTSPGNTSQTLNDQGGTTRLRGVQALSGDLIWISRGHVYVRGEGWTTDITAGAALDLTDATGSGGVVNGHSATLSATDGVSMIALESYSDTVEVAIYAYVKGFG